MHHRNDKLIKIDPTIMVRIDSVHNIVYLFTIHYRVVIFYTNNDRCTLKNLSKLIFIHPSITIFINKSKNTEKIVTGEYFCSLDRTCDKLCIIYQSVFVGVDTIHNIFELLVCCVLFLGI